MSISFSGWEVTYDDDSVQQVELGDSQALNNQSVYTMYHGTSLANARVIIANGFRQSTKGMLGPGVYVSRNQAKAERYPLNSSFNDRVVLQLRVHVGRVKRIAIDNHPLQYTWNAAGFDSAWVPPNCGMKAVPSGLEEDCVFDPNRVEVIGIAKAPSSTILTELQQLLAQSPKRPWTGQTGAAQGGSSNAGVCSLCKRKTTPGKAHHTQPCWGCGENICILMTKHVCLANSRW